MCIFVKIAHSLLGWISNDANEGMMQKIWSESHSVAASLQKSKMQMLGTKVEIGKKIGTASINKAALRFLNSLYETQYENLVIQSNIYIEINYITYLLHTLC